MRLCSKTPRGPDSNLRCKFCPQARQKSVADFGIEVRTLHTGKDEIPDSRPRIQPAPDRTADTTQPRSASVHLERQPHPVQNNFLLFLLAFVTNYLTSKGA